MLKKLALGGAVVAAFAGMGFATPAQAATPWPGGDKINVSQQNDNTVVCGNKTIGDITIPIIPLTPVTLVDREPVNCNITNHQS